MRCAAVVDGSGGANDLAGARIPIVSPDGKKVYVSGYSDNAITAFARNPTWRGMSNEIIVTVTQLNLYLPLTGR